MSGALSLQGHRDANASACTPLSEMTKCGRQDRSCFLLSSSSLCRCEGAREDPSLIEWISKTETPLRTSQRSRNATRHETVIFLLIYLPLSEKTLHVPLVKNSRLREVRGEVRGVTPIDQRAAKKGAAHLVHGKPTHSIPCQVGKEFEVVLHRHECHSDLAVA